MHICLQRVLHRAAPDDHFNKCHMHTTKEYFVAKECVFSCNLISNNKSPAFEINSQKYSYHWLWWDRDLSFLRPKVWSMKSSTKVALMTMSTCQQMAQPRNIVWLKKFFIDSSLSLQVISCHCIGCGTLKIWSFLRSKVKSRPQSWLWRALWQMSAAGSKAICQVNPYGYKIRKKCIVLYHCEK